MAEKTKKVASYDDSSIQVLEGLEAVRARPGMYIGSNDTRGLHHLVWEIVDNSVDEALAGVCTEITVVIENDNSITVSDNGRGIPIGMNKQKKRPNPEVIFNELHAGGKFDSKGGYSASGGLHGVGSSVVNALSSLFEVTIHRDGKVYYQRFLNGGKKIEKPIIEDGDKKTGTKIHFKPDQKCFTSTIYDYKTVAQRLRESAYLNKGLKLNLEDKRESPIKKESFQYDNGLIEFCESFTKTKEPLHNPAKLYGTYNSIEATVVFQYSNKSYNENIQSYVNNVRTGDGGTHEVGFKSGLTRAFNEHARIINALKDKDPNLDGADIREGITVIISVRIPDDILQFESQTKEKLGTPEAKLALESITYEQVKNYFAENGKVSEAIIQKAIRAQKAREASRKVRDELRIGKEKASKPANLLGKLTPAQFKNPQKNELFLVEGDSAGGSAKQGRDRTFQAILPLRGKVLNTYSAKLDKVFANEEIVSIINAIGAGFGSEFDYKKSNYNKVIIMTDADTDGAHIQTLLLTFFFRYMTPLIEQGMVYIATPPLYKISGKNSIEYAWTDEELREKVGAQKNINIQRYKGLGEMNAEQLWETTMEPGKRSLIQVNIDDLGEAEKCLDTLMGDDPEKRREWIENTLVFDADDNFVLEEAISDEQ